MRGPLLDLLLLVFDLLFQLRPLCLHLVRAGREAALVLLRLGEVQWRDVRIWALPANTGSLVANTGSRICQYGPKPFEFLVFLSDPNGAT